MICLVLENVCKSNKYLIVSAEKLPEGITSEYKNTSTVKEIELNENSNFSGLDVDKALKDIQSCNAHIINCTYEIIENWKEISED